MESVSPLCSDDITLTEPPFPSAIADGVCAGCADFENE